MPIDPGPNGPDDEQGSGAGSLLSMILAIVISAVIIWFVVSTSRRHAVPLDEGAPPAAAPAQPPHPPAP